MDPVTEIKARLPIEQLVSQYCQLIKKGRGFVCLCPFHNDSRPSMQVSPDKGIAYCFACSSGGDIFSFYQKIEGVEFRQAVKDLAEKTGVEIPVVTSSQPVVSKDEKTRLRECLESALRLYRAQYLQSSAAQAYMLGRGVTPELIERFEIGVAPDGFSATYDQLLKDGFSRSEILQAGMAIQKDLDGRVYDRFRNRLMFPIRDHQGKLIGFGGRTLGDDDAKYINSAESPLYSKSHVLFGLDKAREAIRESKQVILVEGYFDVLACHKAGRTNAVAVCGTALTPEHVTLLKRMVETIVLCLDQDTAGQAAAERAFLLCAEKGLQVNAVKLDQKDPAEVALSDPGLLSHLLSASTPYLDSILDALRSTPLQGIEEKKRVLDAVLPLLRVLPGSVERQHYVALLAQLLSTVESAIMRDLERHNRTPPAAPAKAPETGDKRQSDQPFSAHELTLGMLMMHPAHLPLLQELIEPSDGLAAALYTVLKNLGTASEPIAAGSLGLPQELSEKAGILQLYCEQYGFQEWSEKLAVRELRRNIRHANHLFLIEKQKDITRQLLEARREGKTLEEEKLNTRYLQILKLAKMVG